MQTQDITKFEFILTLEKNIVIQRFFNVNRYNPKTKNSIDLYECVTEICKEISSDLKAKTLDYMNENANYFTDAKNSEESTDNKEENFLLQIKLGNDVFISRIFPAHIYHPKARYAVDIRPKVRKILSDLTNVLSSERPTKTYLQYEIK
jgi:hypothetical protein